MFRERNGYIDDGKRIQTKQKCWNCGSSQYYQTVSIEHCPSCGIKCDYWGGGANEKYESASNARYQRIERDYEERMKLEQEQYYWDNQDD